MTSASHMIPLSYTITFIGGSSTTTSEKIHLSCLADMTVTSLELAFALDCCRYHLSDEDASIRDIGYFYFLPGTPHEL